MNIGVFRQLRLYVAFWLCMLCAEPTVLFGDQLPVPQGLLVRYSRNAHFACVFPQAARDSYKFVKIKNPKKPDLFRTGPKSSTLLKQLKTQLRKLKKRLGQASSVSDKIKKINAQTNEIKKTVRTCNAIKQPVLPDDDHDGISDTWELDYGLNPSIDDSALDPDNDGLTHLEEYYLRSDPFLPNSSLQAFPEAVGFGAYSFGGRGDGKTGTTPSIVHVTTRSDNRTYIPATGGYSPEPGSLRAALEATGPRFVVFDVGGVFDLTAPLLIESPFITVAGQTAPPPGVTIAHYPVKAGTHDVVIRSVRFRPYITDTDIAQSYGEIMDCTGIYSGSKDKPAYNIIFDHISMAWGVDETFDAWEWATNYTLQNSLLVAGAVYGHPMGLAHNKAILVGGEDSSSAIYGRGTFFQNAYIGFEDRVPAVGSSHTIQWENNLVYNSFTNSGPAGFSYGPNASRGAMVDFVANRYIKGLDTNPIYGLQHVIKVSAPSSQFPERTPKLFIRENIAPHLHESTDVDAWRDVGVTYYILGCNSNYPNSYCSNWLHPYINPYAPNSDPWGRYDSNSRSLYELNSAPPGPLLPSIAASELDQVLDSIGVIAPVRDAVDLDAVQEIASAIALSEENPKADIPTNDARFTHVGPHAPPGYSMHSEPILRVELAGDLGSYNYQNTQYRWIGATLSEAKATLVAGIKKIEEINGEFQRDFIDSSEQLAILNNTHSLCPCVWKGEDGTMIKNIPDLQLIQSLYPVSSASAVLDTDGDYIPNNWEIANGTKPEVNDSLQVGANGYLNIENYLNSIVDP